MTRLNLTLYGEPRSKKNSMQIVRIGTSHRLIQSKNYRDYEQDAVRQIEDAHKAYHVDYRVNIRYTFFRSSKRRVDLSNLIAAADDILVKAGVIEDDNWKIVVSHDGSRIRFDPIAPRTEIEITEAHDEL
jgi:Holliday junction resolvase RusA-like endonuclease